MTSDPQLPSRRSPVVLVVVLVGAILGAAIFAAASDAPPKVTLAAVSTSTSHLPPPTSRPQTTTTLSVTTTTQPTRGLGTVPSWTVGQPWGETIGLTMFRGNPTRTFYGTGPLPRRPRVLWSYPADGLMCGSSSVAGVSSQWCGSGWTGQPVVWERPDGITEVIFGAYDKAVHFLDAHTGEELRPSFHVGDIIKGSVTLDPDGFPLLYFGSRDNRLRILALDRSEPIELWGLEASAVDGIWNDDWDGNPVVIDDVMYEGGENGWFFAIKLNRDFESNGLVAVTPEVLFQSPAWNDELLALVGRNVSIESSVMVNGQIAYLANSGGRVLGFDVSEILSGVATEAFDFWVGDDTDATLVSDSQGHIYVAVEEERRNERSRQLGQLIKLDPAADDPYLWGLPVPGVDDVGGLWATPALGDGVLYAATHPGQLLAVAIATGEVVWQEEIGWHAWSSPVIVHDELLVATCGGELRSYDLSEPRSPSPVWSLQLSTSCIESTPAVWRGMIFVGARDGKFYAVGES